MRHSQTRRNPLISSVKQASLVLLLILVPIAKSMAQPGKHIRKIPPGSAHTAHASSTNSYCISYGGSVAYESIQDVTVIENTDGTLTIKVDVRIANPTGCQSGEPCPAYDANPEYVNVWIDFDGNNRFDPYERVMDAELSGYRNINYDGVMRAESSTSVPKNAVRPTYLRANLGWGYDANDPCDQGWRYGNVWNEQVLSNVKVSEIWSQFEIPIRNVENPLWVGEFDRRGNLNRELKNEPVAWAWKFGGEFNYRIILESFPSGIDQNQLIPTLECNWQFEGSNYKGTSSFAGWNGVITGGVPRKVGKFPLRMDFKIYDNNDKLISKQTIRQDPVYIIYYLPVVLDPYHGDPKPPVEPLENWYDRAVTWAKDGKNPRDIANKLMQSISSNPLNWQYLTQPSYWSEMIEKDASKRKQFGVCTNYAQIFHNLMGVLGVLGSEIVSTSALWPGKKPVSYLNRPAIDGQAGSAYESGFFFDGSYDRWIWGSHFWAKYKNTHYDPTLNNIFTKPSENIEWLVNSRGAAYDSETQTELKAFFTFDGERLDSGWSTASYRVVEPVALRKKQNVAANNGVRFSGTFTGSGHDTDMDGQYNYLGAEIGVEILEPGDYALIPALYFEDEFITDREGYIVPGVASYPVTGDPGTQTISVKFSGEEILSSSNDGVYTVRAVLIDTSDATVDSVTFVTQPISYEQFGEFPGRIISGEVNGQDTNGDGQWDWLLAEIDVKVTYPTGFNLTGTLWQDTLLVTNAAHGPELTPGVNSVNLYFKGSDIAASDLDGPYTLKLTLLDSTASASDQLELQTPAFSYTQFQAPIVSLTNTFSDEGLDINGNGLFDSLTVEIGIDVDSSGQFRITGWLQNSLGEDIVSAGRSMELTSGDNNARLHFPGSAIYEQGQDGSLTLSYLVISDEQNIPVLSSENVYLTEAYAFSDFEPPAPPLLISSGEITDMSIDSDGNGLFDSLAFLIDISVLDSGNVWAIGRIFDGQGEEIAWAATPSYVRPGPDTKALLLFDGRFVYGSHMDGPYYLENLRLYHAGDPDQDVNVPGSFQTASYRYSDFETAGIISGNVTDSLGLPISDAVIYINGIDDDYSNSDGEYVINTFEDANYTVHIQGPDSSFVNWSIFLEDVLVGQDDTVQVSVKNGEIINLDFQSPLISVPPVQVSIPRLTAETGSDIEVAVSLGQLPPIDVYSADIRLNYDPDVVHATHASTFGTVAELWGNPTFNIKDGEVLIAMAGASALPDSGELVVIGLEAVGSPGDSSAIRITDFTLNEGIPPVTLNDGMVLVQASTDVASTASQIPKDLRLDQNYPNPFNPATYIAFAIPAGAGEVKLEIYSIFGVKIRTLVNERLNPGSYNIQWDGKTQDGTLAASGIYLYRLNFGSQTESRKMLMLK